MKKKRHHISRWLLLLLLVALGLWLASVCLSHGNGSQQPMAHQLRVLTWNTHRMGNFEKVPQNAVIQYLLLRQQADVVCLQEVEVYKDAQWLTLQELRDAMRTKYPYSYIDFAVYNRRRQFGNVIFSRYPLINKQTIDYPSRANISSRCDVVVGTDTLRLINNHLESNRFERQDFAQHDDQRTSEQIKVTTRRLGTKWMQAQALRREQARVVRAEADRSPYPCIIVGDFNDLPFSYAYHHIRGHMHDCWLETGGYGHAGLTYRFRQVGIRIGVRIDYIFCSPELTPLSTRIDREDASDHYPVAALIGW